MFEAAIDLFPCVWWLKLVWGFKNLKTNFLRKNWGVSLAALWGNLAPLQAAFTLKWPEATVVGFWEKQEKTQIKPISHNLDHPLNCPKKDQSIQIRRHSAQNRFFAIF
jgi:hypothetical protein